MQLANMQNVMLILSLYVKCHGRRIAMYNTGYNEKVQGCEDFVATRTLSKILSCKMYEIGSKMLLQRMKNQHTQNSM